MDAQFCRFCASPISETSGNGQQNQARFNNQQWNQGFQGNQQAQQFVQPSTGTSKRAIVSVLLNIGGLLLCFPLLSIIGAILGWMEVSAIKEGRSPSGGLGMAQTGMWSGIIISIVGFLLCGVFFLILIGSGAMY
ncbi:MAG TPA: DUF4190 domain-containing protein [Pyrinomonadaceae bacterium]